MSRRSMKRRSQSPKYDIPTSQDENMVPVTLKEKRRKFGAKQDSISSKSSADSNGKSTSIQKPGDNSSDSSSDGFEQPPILAKSGTVHSVIKQDPVTIDFSAIENNILSGVSRLSDSEDSDFEDVKSSQSSTKAEENEPKVEVPVGLPTSASEKNVGEKGRKGKSKGKSKSKESKAKVPPSPKKTETNILSSTVVNKMDVSQLLSLGEGSSTGTQLKMEDIVQDSESDTENELADWEDVEGLDIKPVKHTIPESGVEVTLQMPDIYRRRRKKEFDMEAHLKRRLNRIKRGLQVLIHKVHLLCWIAHGRYVNVVLNSEVLMGISLSLIPSQHCRPPKHTNLCYLEQISEWFKKTVNVKETVVETSSEPLCESLQNQFQSRMANSTRDLVLMFICLLRALGIKTRLILSLQPLPLKPSSEELCTVGQQRGRRSSTAVNEIKEETEVKPELENTETDSGTKSVKKGIEMQKDSKDPGESKKKIQKKSVASVKAQPSPSSKKSGTPRKRDFKNAIKNKDDVGLSDEKMDKLKRALRQRKEITNIYKDASSSSEEETRRNIAEKNENDSTPIRNKENSKSQPHSSKGNKKEESKRSSKGSGNSIQENDTPKVQSERRRKSIQGSANPNKQPIKNSSSGDNEIQTQQGKKRRSLKNDSDSDFEPASLTQKKSKGAKGMDSLKTDTDSESEFEPKKTPSKRKSSTGKTLDRRVLSSDSCSSSDGKTKKKARKCTDVWAEVFLEEEERWISVDVPAAKVHCVNELHRKATQPVSYVLAFNNDLTLKDVTCRYCAQFATITRKLRVDEGWWKQSLKPFHTRRTAQDREEDEELNRLILDRPMPTALKDFKNHPLYVLKDDLLKFEAIYPPDAPPLGYVKSKPVYARECVHVLHSREVWLKEAKVVRLGEEPYKIVKARPKYDKMSGQFIKDLPLEVFGPWQVEDYMPPVAVDGKVPRNEYGNVELFKPSMLPIGTVQLCVPGLNRVARKLGIDCAPAMIGFDFHAGGTHPVFDGFVVCEEFKDILLDAWNQEQDEAEKRRKEKLEKRVYGNWRRLIKGLLIRERLKLRYSFGEEAGPSKPTIFSKDSKLLSLVDNSPKVNRKSTANRGRKNNVVPRTSDKKGKQKVGRKKRKVESEEESESDEDEEEEEEEDDDDDEDFDSDKDWN